MVDSYVKINRPDDDHLICRLDPARLLLQHVRGGREVVIDLRPFFEAAGVRLVTLDEVMQHERYGAPLA